MSHWLEKCNQGSNIRGYCAVWKTIGDHGRETSSSEYASKSGQHPVHKLRHRHQVHLQKLHHHRHRYHPSLSGGKRYVSECLKTDFRYWHTQFPEQNRARRRMEKGIERGSESGAGFDFLEYKLSEGNNCNRLHWALMDRKKSLRFPFRFSFLFWFRFHFALYLYFKFESTS